MNRFLALFFITSVVIFGQTRTYSPVQDTKSYTVWDVTACGGQDLPAGQIYQELVQHGVTPLFNVQAETLVTALPAKSIWAKVAKWAGYGVEVAALAVTVKAIAANQVIVDGLTAASGVLNGVIPYATKLEPNTAPAWSQLLVRDNQVLRVAPGNCDTAAVLGGRGKAFIVGVVQ